MDWIRFGHPHFLYLLWGTPIFIVLYIYAFRQKRKAYQRFSSHHFFQRLTTSVHFGRQKAKVILMSLSYTFLILALSRPQIGTTLELVKRSGLDIMVGLDISASCWRRTSSRIGCSRQNMPSPRLLTGSKVIE